jgi:hypothetical protein
MVGGQTDKLRNRLRRNAAFREYGPEDLLGVGRGLRDRRGVDEAGLRRRALP